jgi:broad specificity phosphatase PhoE
LNDEGKKQAQNAGAELKSKKIDLIISSPYKRTQETAKIIAAELGMSEGDVVTDERVQEWQVGEENNGKTWDQFYAENAGVNYFHHLMKGASETKIDIQNRINRMIDELEEKYSGKNILVVTHKSPIAAIISRSHAELLEMGDL